MATTSSIGLAQIVALYSVRLRHEADSDYVAARHLYQLGLRQQFLWPAQQALEKYLKSTLLFFGRRINDTHDLCCIFEQLERTLVDDRGLAITVPPYLHHFLLSMTAFGVNRYATSFAYTTGCEMLELDEVVWCLRRYCDSPVLVPDGSSTKDFTPESFTHLNRIETYQNPHAVRIMGGELERILRDRESALATILREGNNYFGEPAESITVHISSEMAFPMRRSVAQWLDEENGVHREARLSDLDKYVPGMKDAYKRAQIASPASGSRRSLAILENGKTPWNQWILLHPYVASNRSKVFHRRKCRNQKGIPENNRVRFETMSEATEHGYAPAHCCT